MVFFICITINANLIGILIGILTGILTGIVIGVVIGIVTGSIAASTTGSITIGNITRLHYRIGGRGRWPRTRRRRP